MTADEHPSLWRPTYVTCQTPGCAQPAQARVCLPLLPETTGPGLGFIIVRPGNSPVQIGELLCLDCVHHGVDLMLLRATKAPR